MQEVPLSVKTWRWCLQVDWGLEVVKGSGAVDFAAFKAARLLWHSISMKHTESGNKDYLFLFDTLKSQICLAPVFSSWVYLLNCCDGALLCRGHFHDVAAGGIWLAVLHLPCCDEAHQPLLPHWGKAHWLIGPWVSAVWKVLQHSQGPVCPQIKVPASMNKLSLTCKHFFWSSCWGQIYAPLLGSDCSNFALATFFEPVFWAGGFFWDEVNEASDSLVRSRMVKTEAGWQCTDCSFSGSVNVLYKHIESEHVSVSFKCGQCHKSCKSRDALFAHRYRYHRNNSNRGSSKEGQIGLPWV